MVCGLDSLSFPPTITKLIYNVLDNLHLILFPHPASEENLLTFPRKGQPVYHLFTYTILETCSVSLILQSCILDPSLSIDSFPLACTRDQIYPIFKNKTKNLKNQNVLALVPASTLSVVAFSTFLHCQIYCKRITAT